MSDGCVIALLFAVIVEALMVTCVGLFALLGSRGLSNPLWGVIICIVCLLAGLGQIAPAAFVLHRRWGLRSSVIEEQIVALAEATRAPVTVADVAAQVGCSPELARKTLDSMTARQLCEQTGPQEYVVQGVGGQKIQRACPYCGASLPVRDQLLECPGCGGNLELKREM